MKAGALNRRVTIESLTRTPDGAGGFTEGWSTLSEVWANAQPVGGREALVAGTLQASQGWRIEMRFRGDVTTEHRLQLDGLALNIRSVVDMDGKRQSIVLLCDSAV